MRLREFHAVQVIKVGFESCQLKMWWRTLICQHQIHNNVFIGAYVLRPHLIAGAFIGLSLSPYFWPPLESGLRWWDGGGLPSHRSRRLPEEASKPEPRRELSSWEVSKKVSRKCNQHKGSLADPSTEALRFQICVCSLCILTPDKSSRYS